MGGVSSILSHSFSAAPTAIAFIVGVLLIIGFIIINILRNESKKGKRAEEIAFGNSVTSEQAIGAKRQKIVKVGSLKVRLPTDGIEVAKNIPSVINESLYSVMAFTQHGIRFGRVPESLIVSEGKENPVYLDPSMPRPNTWNYLTILKEDNKYHSYDPRHIPLEDKETPQFAFGALDWPEVKDVFGLDFSLWDKINTILVACLGGGILIVILVALDKIGK